MRRRVVCEDRYRLDHLAAKDRGEVSGDNNSSSTGSRSS